MANWKSTLDISDLHDAYEARCLSPPEVTDYVEVDDDVSWLSDSVAARMKEHQYFVEGIVSFMNLAYAFEGIDDIEDYDAVLEELFDWADVDHRLWVKTL